MRISHNILIQILIILIFALLVFLLCLLATTDFALAENILILYASVSVILKPRLLLFSTSYFNYELSRFITRQIRL